MYSKRFIAQSASYEQFESNTSLKRDDNTGTRSTGKSINQQYSTSRSHHSLITMHGFHFLCGTTELFLDEGHGAVENWALAKLESQIRTVWRVVTVMRTVKSHNPGIIGEICTVLFVQFVITAFGVGPSAVDVDDNFLRRLSKQRVTRRDGYVAVQSAIYRIALNGAGKAICGECTGVTFGEPGDFERHDGDDGFGGENAIRTFVE